MEKDERKAHYYTQGRDEDNGAFFYETAVKFTKAWRLYEEALYWYKTCNEIRTRFHLDIPAELLETLKKE